MVDDVAAYHAALVAKIREAYGKMLGKGLPRILAKALDNARILRAFKQDDRAAFRALDSGLRRHAETASETAGERRQVTDPSLLRPWMS